MILFRPAHSYADVLAIATTFDRRGLRVSIWERHPGPTVVVGQRTGVETELDEVERIDRAIEQARKEL